MAYYYSIPIEEMEEELESYRFYPVSLMYRNRPVKEWVYERKLPRSPNHFVRVYTGINRYGPSAGESRKSGKDAIRIQVIYRDTKGETLVSQPKRIHRVGGWRKNLKKRMDEVAKDLPQVQFDSRGEPMTLRKKGNSYFWGSRDYPKYKETKPFRAEEIRCCKECDKTTGLTTIQAGTYCYDCLPINLGAEDEIPIIDLNSKKEIEQYGMFESYDPVVRQFSEERKRRESLENNNFFRINCDGVYAVRAIWGPSKVMYGRNMLASNKVSFNKSQQVHLSKVWEKLGLPRYNSGVVSAYGPLRRKSRLPKYMKPNWVDTWVSQKDLNIIVINMKGLVFAYDFVHQEIEFYGGVPESSIVSQDIPPEVVKVNTQYEMAEPQDWGHSIRENARDYEYTLRRYGGKNSRRFRQGLKGEIDVPDEEYISYWKQFAADDYDATYGVEQAKIRRRLKNKIKKQAIMGTKAGQWSARKSQELKRQYEAACDKKGLNPYKGKKTKSQDNLSKWSKQKWGTASGRKSSVTGEPYFPAKAVAELKKKELYSKAKRQKAQATRAGKQNARYSDDIRKVVAKYRAEDEDIVIADFKNMSAAEIQTYAPDNWKIVMYWAADGSTYILRRIFKTESYGEVVDLIDEINLIASELNHHPMVTFDKERVMIQLWTHDVHNITELDIAFAELLNQFADKWELNAESPDWEDIDWKTDKPPAKKGPEDWGDDVEWDAEDEEDEITLKEFDETTADDFVKDSDEQIALMLRNKSKINRNGDIGCPVCGSIGLFYEEIIAKGKKWYCYGCLYEDKEETIKGKGDITLEKYGLEITCPICKKAVKAFNNDSMLRHMKKCGVPK